MKRFDHDLFIIFFFKHTHCKTFEEDLKQHKDNIEAAILHNLKETNVEMDMSVEDVTTDILY